jgi:hypothetical protein
MRYLTNDYRDSQILDLGSGGERGPYLVTQTGCSPNTNVPKTHLFVLRPDGQWVDFNAYACQQKPELMDELVFATTADVMSKFARLMGPPRVLDLPVDEAGLKAWIARREDESPLVAARKWAVQYRQRPPKK